ncbi:hypothetical protein cyc_09255 [Cyclospora cayetanensis]|uniref:Secreted protein n=1 Tax=Cyclospora cayetanensis TaxID=88456 RepID=A0A1D3D9Y3_9EIME|nr:hypothetical protein cyc_09255 [Cyclospora cayetanensis]
MLLHMLLLQRGLPRGRRLLRHFALQLKLILLLLLDGSCPLQPLPLQQRQILQGEGAGVREPHAEDFGGLGEDCEEAAQLLENTFRCGASHREALTLQSPLLLLLRAFGEQQHGDGRQSKRLERVSPWEGGPK